MPTNREPTRWPVLFAAMALVCLVGAVFFPIVGFEFVDLDVPRQVIKNPHVQSLSGENLKHILTSPSVTSYYPVRTLSYAVDCQLWGLHAGGFKLTNGLLHLANTLLVFWLVLRLFRHPAAGGGKATTPWELSLATFSAGAFAVHPVVVEPVAWVPGREELLMTLGALGCLHFHLAARRLGEAGGRTRAMVFCYAGAALCCAAACLSNAVAAIIPLLITAWDLLTLTRPTLARMLGGTAALWAIGLATVALKKICEFHDTARVAPIPAIDRMMLVVHLYWLDLKTLLWPQRVGVYPPDVSPQSFLDPGVMLGGAALGLTAVLLWKLRRRKLALFGLIWFGLALAPTLQIMPHHVQRADRFLYLPLVGLAVAVAMGLRPLGRALKPRTMVGAAAVAVSLLVALAVRSAFQVQTWRNALSMWENCVRHDPQSTIGNCALADNLAKAGQFRRAVRHYERAEQLAPYDGRILTRFATLLATCRDEKLRDYERAVELAERAFFQDPRNLRTFILVQDKLAQALAERGELDRAIETYKRLLDLAPNYRPALLRLAWLRATCADERLRSPQEAVRLAERACQGGTPPDADGLSILAEAYAAAERLDMAVAAAKRAIKAAEEAGDARLADKLRRRLKRYQNEVPSAKGAPGAEAAKAPQVVPDGPPSP